MQGDALADLAGVSKLAYGNMHTLVTILVIADRSDGLIYHSELARELARLIEDANSGLRPISGSTVSGTLTTLAALGMLLKLPEDGNRKPYEPIWNSSGWSWARELAGSRWPLPQVVADYE